MTQEFVLGVDGGGTKTELVLADLNGVVVAQQSVGATNLAAVSAQTAVANLTEGLRALFAQLQESETAEEVADSRGLVTTSVPAQPNIVSAVVGQAGVDTPQDEQEFRALAQRVFSRFGIGQWQLVNDSEIALASGSSQADALVLIAGTGSICWGRNAAGSTVRTGGMDHLLADEGSGYWIAVEMLKAVVRAHDGRAEPTALTQLVLNHWQLSSVDALKNVVYQPSMNKMELAKLAKVWEVGVNQDDVVANSILERAVAELSLLVSAAARALSLTDQPADLVLAGSIAKLSFIQTPLRAHLNSILPQLSILVPDRPPVMGAVKLALQHISNA